MPIMETVCECGHGEAIHREIGRYDKAHDKYWSIIGRCKVPGCPCHNFRIARIREHDLRRRPDGGSS